MAIQEYSENQDAGLLRYARNDARCGLFRGSLKEVPFSCARGKLSQTRVHLSRCFGYFDNLAARSGQPSPEQLRRLASSCAGRCSAR